MADTITRTRVTLHPLKDDGTMDLNTNLYPKTFLDGIVDRNGEDVDVVTQPELDEAVANIEQEIQDLPKGDVTEEELTAALAGKQDTLTAGDNITIENGVISATANVNNRYGEITSFMGDSILFNGQDTTGAKQEFLNLLDANDGELILDTFIFNNTSYSNCLLEDDGDYTIGNTTYRAVNINTDYGYVTLYINTTASTQIKTTYWLGRESTRKFSFNVDKNNNYVIAYDSVFFPLSQDLSVNYVDRIAFIKDEFFNGLLNTFFKLILEDQVNNKSYEATLTSIEYNKKDNTANFTLSTSAGNLSASFTITNETRATLNTLEFNTSSTGDLETYYISFYNKMDEETGSFIGVALNGDLYDWMTNNESFSGRMMSIAINDDETEMCSINKGYYTNNNNVHINININNYSSFGNIHLMYNGVLDDVEDYSLWTVDLSYYFPTLYTESTWDDFYPSITLIDGELERDNVITPEWASDIDGRLYSLAYMPIKAWLYTSVDEYYGEPVDIYIKYDEDNNSNNCVVHIKTGNGEYKLTYQYNEDELGE